jgi:hypothetical protein
MFRVVYYNSVKKCLQTHRVFYITRPIILSPLHGVNPQILRQHIFWSTTEVSDTVHQLNEDQGAEPISRGDFKVANNYLIDASASVDEVGYDYVLPYIIKRCKIRTNQS